MPIYFENILQEQKMACFYQSGAEVEGVSLLLALLAYVRYMDDMLLWHNDKEELLKIGRRFQKFIASELLLELKALLSERKHKRVAVFGISAVFRACSSCTQKQKTGYRNIQPL